METHPQSLYGRAYLIRNMLRGGGPTTDDDRYSLRVISDEILSKAALVRQQELYDLDARGYTPDPTRMVSVLLELIGYAGNQPHGVAVVVRQAILPDTLQWQGNPAIFGLTTRPEKYGWAVKANSADAIRSATRRFMIPPKPAAWLESNVLCVALPTAAGDKYDGIYDLYARCIPAKVNIRTDGTEMDVEAEALTLNDQQWAKIEPLVLQSLNPMLQTTTNADKRNDGKDGQ